MFSNLSFLFGFAAAAIGATVVVRSIRVRGLALGILIVVIGAVIMVATVHH